MLGFGALGQFALGEGPFVQSQPVGGRWEAPVRRAGLAVAVIATTFVGFVPPPPAQAAIPFTQFAQPFASRALIPDEQPSWLFESVPVQPPFTGFCTFEGIVKAKFNVALHAGRWWGPITLPVDTHDGVWVKKKRKKHDRDPIDLELEEKASRRAAIELAVYGPEVVYQPPAAKIPDAAPAAPPDVEGLARAILQAKASEREAERLALEDDEEEILNLILRDL